MMKLSKSFFLVSTRIFAAKQSKHTPGPDTRFFPVGLTGVR